MIALLLALLAAGTPYPPSPTTPDPGEIPPGQCAYVVGDIMFEEGEPVTGANLIVKCAISDSVSRMFEVPIEPGSFELMDLAMVVDILTRGLDAPDDVFEVH